MSQEAHTDINLIPKKEFEEQPTSKKLYFWMIGVGRLIVITTELVAVLVWLSRFRLDYEITNLQANIEDKAALVKMSNRFEDNLRNYQTKTEEINDILASKISFSQGLSQIESLTPTGVTLQNLNFTPTDVHLQAIASSSIPFAMLISSLTSSEAIDRVSLSQSRLEGPSGRYLFELNLTVNERIFK